MSNYEQWQMETYGNIIAESISLEIVETNIEERNESMLIENVIGSY